MRIQTEDGVILELPDGSTDEQIGDAINHYLSMGSTKPSGELSYGQIGDDISSLASQGGNPSYGGIGDAIGKMRDKYAPQIDSKKDAIVQELEGMKRNLPTAPASLPVGMTPDMVKAASASSQQFNNMIDAVKSDESRRAQYELAKKASAGESFGVSAVNELTALGKGIAHLGDKYLPSPVSNALHGFSGTPEERMKQRAVDMAQQNATQEGLSLAHPIASMTGQALPYLLTDVIGTPAIGAAGNAAMRGVKPVANAVLRTAETAEKAAAGSASPLLQQMGKIVAEPIVTTGKYLQNAPVRDIEYSKALKSMARAPILGAAEGGANYNSTWEQGAFNSLGGQALGAFGTLTKLGRSTNLLTESEKLALKNAMREGYTASPGMRTGNIAMQKFEAGLRSEPGFDLYMQNVDNANNVAKAKMAAKAMGLDGVDARDISPAVLTAHLDNLKNTYNNLEQNTTGKMGTGKVIEAGKVLKELQPTKNRNTSPLDRERYYTVKSIFDQFKAEIASPRRGAGGRFEGYQFDGSQYQSIRQRVSDEASQAYRNGDKRLGDSLNKLKGILDDSLTQGMDKATASAWKDANEKYAMTKMVMDKGMDNLGGIDSNKLTAHMLSDAEAQRTLTGTGKNIKYLQDIAKITEMERRQGGAVGWNGTGIESPSAKSGMWSRLLKMPIASSMMPTKRAGMGLYMSGFPAVTGYTGLPKPAITSMARAESQAGGLPTAGKDYVMGAYQDLLNAIKSKQ